MAANTSPSVPQLFTELERLGRDGNYSKAQKICNKSKKKVLAEIPGDKDALHCKVVCLMHQSCFREAVDVINSGSRKGIIELPFEKAYCLYRLNRTKESFEILQSISEQGPREKELMVQLLYKLEEYSRCLELYKDLIKNSSDDYGDERETNLSAVIAAACQWGNLNLDAGGLREDTYELCYNSACLLLAQNKIKQAEEKLKLAEELCKKSLEDDPDVTEEEIASELGVARTQLGYSYHLQGRNDEAMKMYNQVLKSRPSDIAVAAVASNNIITLNKDRDVFDSKKKVKAASVDGLEHKLTRAQQQTLVFNRCLVLLYSNQLEACNSMITKLEADYPDSDFPCLMRASLFQREKHPEKAVSLLEKYSKDHPEKSTNVKLTLVQLCLAQGDIQTACRTLHSITDLQHRPGVVSALVVLYTHLDDVNAAVSVLDSAVEFAQQNKGAIKQSEVLALMRENVAYKLRHGRGNEAIATLERLRKEDPSDMKTLGQLVTAYAQVDLKKAERYSEDLPSLESLSEEGPVDVDRLESTHSALGSRYHRKLKEKEEPTPGKLTQEIIVKRRTKKKKKGKLPKNYNPEVDPDPERWIPRRERSYYKGKRQKKTAVGKGTQGTVSAGTDSPSSPRAGASSPKPSSPARPTGASSPGGAANVVPPRQQQPQASKKKQRPKKKKGGW